MISADDERYGHVDHFMDGTRQRGWHGRAVYDPDDQVRDPAVEMFLRWEHDLARPEYPHWFLDQVVPE